MDVSSSDRGRVTVVSITGSVDALTAPALADALQKQTTMGHARIVADLNALEYTSSAGLRVLLSAVKEARQHGGDVRLAAVRHDVLKVLELSGFTTILKLYPDVEAAVASFA